MKLLVQVTLFIIFQAYHRAAVDNTKEHNYYRPARPLHTINPACEIEWQNHRTDDVWNMCIYLRKNDDCKSFWSMARCMFRELTTMCGEDRARAWIAAIKYDIPTKDDPICKCFMEYMDRGGPSGEQCPKNDAGHIETLALNQLVAFAIAVVFASIHKYFH
ncbi:hypothetical protein DdX_18271 [Ditylenchus destructor]|uniref:Uncharacterized protein n=1 Tax=Ditylenchus destructor TaxID=166010 RepID=A0AAD4QY87_9BILA|nr:hypothetical protein DdX_18271 [Ditylenchus destructor]